jgi:hypothetical protein
MKNRELSDCEKKLYKFANECALKGIDIEDTFGSVWNLTKETFETIINLTNKNYDFLKKCLNHGSDDC